MPFLPGIWELAVQRKQRPLRRLRLLRCVCVCVCVCTFCACVRASLSRARILNKDSIHRAQRRRQLRARRPRKAKRRTRAMSSPKETKRASTTSLRMQWRTRTKENQLDLWRAWSTRWWCSTRQRLTGPSNATPVLIMISREMTREVQLTGQQTVACFHVQARKLLRKFSRSSPSTTPGPRPRHVFDARNAACLHHTPLLLPRDVALAVCQD